MISIVQSRKQWNNIVDLLQPSSLPKSFQVWFKRKRISTGYNQRKRLKLFIFHFSSWNWDSKPLDKMFTNLDGIQSAESLSLFITVSMMGISNRFFVPHGRIPNLVHSLASHSHFANVQYNPSCSEHHGWKWIWGRRENKVCAHCPIFLVQHWSL